MFKEIIQKLKDDGYITEKQFPDAQPVYNLTFTGLIFDGYNQEHQQQKDIQKLQQTVFSLSQYTFWLTVVIALGTFVAAVCYSLEILNHFFCLYLK